MRYLVRARVKPGRQAALLQAENQTLGEGSCGECDCTERLEQTLKGMGKPFLKVLRRTVET